MKSVTNHPVDKFADPRQELLSITLRFLESGNVDPLSNFYFLEQAAAVLFLMQVANLEPVSLDMATKWTGESPERMRQAIVGYLEYACFSQDDDPYRILGLLPPSSSDAIKQHYRQMMKLFHPDRRLVSDAARAQRYAALINQAYATLNKKSVASVSTHHFASESRHTPRVENNGFSFTIRRKIVQAIVLLAMLGLLILYVMINFNREPVLLSSGPAVPAVSSSSVAQQLSESDLIDDNQLTSSTTDVADKMDELEKDSGSEKIAAPSSNQPLPFRDEPSKKPLVADPPLAGVGRMNLESLIAPAQSSTFVTRDRHTQDTNMHQAEGLAAERVKELPRLKKPLTQIQLNRLLTDFLDSYNQGNLDALMNLIDEDVKTGEAGELGKYGLKNAYGNLFSDTIKRQMILENPYWEMEGIRAVGNMAFNADVQYKGSVIQSHYKGVLTLEVTLVNQQPVITGLFVK